MSSPGPPIAELVDDLLNASKMLVGQVQLRRPNRVSEQARLHWPVLVSGQSAECYVAATLYPNEGDLRFTISLVYRGSNVWRMDFEPMTQIKVNPLLRGHEYSMARIAGPHCHRWEENRMFATPRAIPDPLPFRVPLEGVRNWESAFRHFVGETNIAQPIEVPPWPRKEGLI